jgi:hypothetical protein
MDGALAVVETQDESMTVARLTIRRRTKEQHVRKWLFNGIALFNYDTIKQMEE